MAIPKQTIVQTYPSSSTPYFSLFLYTGTGGLWLNFQSEDTVIATGGLRIQDRAQKNEVRNSELNPVEGRRSWTVTYSFESRQIPPPEETEARDTEKLGKKKHQRQEARRGLTHFTENLEGRAEEDGSNFSGRTTTRRMYLKLLGHSVSLVSSRRPTHSSTPWRPASVSNSAIQSIITEKTRAIAPRHPRQRRTVARSTTSMLLIVSRRLRNNPRY
jgi:hypothetical protein